MTTQQDNIHYLFPTRTTASPRNRIRQAMHLFQRYATMPAAVTSDRLLNAMVMALQDKGWVINANPGTRVVARHQHIFPHWIELRRAAEFQEMYEKYTALKDGAS